MRRGRFATLEAAWRTALACRPPDAMLTFAWLAGLAEVSLRQAGAMRAGGRRGTASRSTFRVAETMFDFLATWGRRQHSLRGHGGGPWGSSAVPPPTSAGDPRPQGVQLYRGERVALRLGLVGRYLVLSGQFRRGTGRKAWLNSPPTHPAEMGGTQ